MVWSALWGYAEILVITPRHNITQWETTGHVIDQHAAKEAWGRLQKATMLNSSNAEFYMDLARLATLQANSPQLSSQDQTLYQEQAIQNLTLALSKRPSWGLAWGKLAQAYATTPEHSIDFIQALERAIYFEPYEEANQQQIIPLGIAQWEKLPDTMKGEIIAITKHALQFQPEIIYKVIKVAVQYDWASNFSLLTKHKWHQDLLNKAMREKEQGEQP